MKEKLIAELQGLADMMPPICDRDRPATVLIFDTPVTVHCKPFEQFQDVLRRAADALADDGVPAQKWIPVTERLPEYGLRVLAAYDDGVVRIGISKGYFPEVVTKRPDAKAFGFAAVTHWMSLPEPPKED